MATHYFWGIVKCTHPIHCGTLLPPDLSGAPHPSCVLVTDLETMTESSGPTCLQGVGVGVPEDDVQAVLCELNLSSSASFHDLHILMDLLLCVHTLSPSFGLLEIARAGCSPTSTGLPYSPPSQSCSHLCSCHWASPVQSQVLCKGSCLLHCYHQHLNLFPRPCWNVVQVVLQVVHGRHGFT